ncbi:hypothetical protein BOTBODRAFT_37925, partial [Botryobasidium botryosum FD-172 SS1]
MMPKLDGHWNPDYSSGYARVAVLLILRCLNGELVADKISAYDREWVARSRHLGPQRSGAHCIPRGSLHIRAVRGRAAHWLL